MLVQVMRAYPFEVATQAVPAEGQLAVVATSSFPDVRAVMFCPFDPDATVVFATAATIPAVRTRRKH